MVDPWLPTISLLSPRPVPVVRWPPSRTRRIVAPPDLEPDLELPPEPRPERSPAIDAEILETLWTLGQGSVRDVARAMGVPRSTVGRRLAALRQAGRVEHDGQAFVTA